MIKYVQALRTVTFLVAAVMIRTAGAQTSRTYTYDAMGNRLAATNQIRFTSKAAFRMFPSVAVPGDRVNIFGRDFPAGPTAQVFVNLASVASRVITVEIPAVATRGPVTLTVSGGNFDLGDLRF